jgi:hypothetical protein
MTHRNPRRRPPKRKPLTADGAVDGLVERIREHYQAPDLTKSEAIRLYLGPRGLVRRSMMEDVWELKAVLFDSLMAKYGDRLAPALRLIARQRRLGQEGAAKRRAKGEETARTIVKTADQLLAAGEPKRFVAGIVARKLGLHAGYVRSVLNKKKRS